VAQPCCINVALAFRLSRSHTFGLRQLTMAHLIDKEFIGRANTVLLLSVLWGGLAVCAIAALAYDIAYWLIG